MSWTDRRSTKVNDEKVYFFHKSLAGLDQQIRNVYIKSVAKFEEEIGVKYTSSLFKTVGNDSDADPILLYLFNLFSDEELTQKALDEILNFYKPKEFDMAKAMAYVDLALILKREDKALEFVEEHKLKLDVIRVVDQKRTNPRICVEEVLYYKASANFSFLKRNSKELSEPCNLTTCIADMLTTVMGKQYGVTELYKQGYCWDAFVLCRLTSSAKFRKIFTSMALPALCSKFSHIGTLQALHSSSDDQSGKSKNLPLSNSLGSVLSYRILKCNFIRLENDSTSTKEERVSKRMNISAVLQELLLNCLSKGEYEICNQILYDFFNTLSEMDGEIQGDMFYALEKIYFKKTFELVISVSELVNHCLGLFQSKLIEQKAPSPNGLFGTFIKFWLDSELYVPKTNDHRLKATKSIFLKLYATAKRKDSKEVMITIALANALTTFTECDLHKSLETLGLKDDTVQHFLTFLRSNLTNQNKDQTFLEICKSFDGLLFNEGNGVSIFTCLDSQLDKVDPTVLTLENILHTLVNNITNLENLKRTTTPALEEEDASRSSSASGFSQATSSHMMDASQIIHSIANKENDVTGSISSGRGSAASQDNISESDGDHLKKEWNSSKAVGFTFRAGGFDQACMHYGFDVRS